MTFVFVLVTAYIRVESGKNGSLPSFGDVGTSNTDFGISTDFSVLAELALVGEADLAAAAGAAMAGMSSQAPSANIQALEKRQAPYRKPLGLSFGA